MTQEHETPDTTPTNRRTDMAGWLSGLAVLLGAWIAISPFAISSSSTGMWNNVLVGLVILLIAGYNYARVSGGRSSIVGGMAIVALLGVWTVAAPFVFEIGSDTLLWSNGIAVLIALLVAGFVANDARQVRAGAPAA